MPCETCMKEECPKPCEWPGSTTQDDAFCHGHPSQLDPLAGLKEEAVEVIHDATKRNEWRCVEKEILVLLSRAFHLGEVSGAKRVVEKVEALESKPGLYDNDICEELHQGELVEAARLVVVELEGKGK